jgi:hypothetical protein
MSHKYKKKHVQDLNIIFYEKKNFELGLIINGTLSIIHLNKVRIHWVGLNYLLYSQNVIKVSTGGQN